MGSCEPLLTYMRYIGESSTMNADGWGGGRDEGMRGMREDSRVRRRLGSKKLGKLTFRLRAKTGKRADMFSLV